MSNLFYFFKKKEKTSQPKFALHFILNDFHFTLHLFATPMSDWCFKKTKLKMILVIERGNYVNMQQWGIIKEIRTQKGPFQVKSLLTPNNAHFMHCNSAPPLMVKNALQWAIWLPPTRGTELSVE